MKNKKGEIATLLTLGLVVVGTLITLGTSLFVSNKKANLASNSRAACTSSYKSCTTVKSTYTIGGYYSSVGKFYKSTNCVGEIVEGVGNYCKSLNPEGAPAGSGTTLPECTFKGTLLANSECGGSSNVTSSGCGKTSSGAQTYKCKTEPAAQPAAQPAAAQAGTVYNCSEHGGGTAYQGVGCYDLCAKKGSKYIPNSQGTGTDGNNYCCCGGGLPGVDGYPADDSCWLVKCSGGQPTKMQYTDSLSKHDMPLSSCNDNMYSGGGKAAIGNANADAIFNTLSCSGSEETFTEPEPVIPEEEIIPSDEETDNCTKRVGFKCSSAGFTGSTQTFDYYKSTAKGCESNTVGGSCYGTSPTSCSEEWNAFVKTQCSPGAGSSSCTKHTGFKCSSAGYWLSSKTFDYYKSNAAGCESNTVGGSCYGTSASSCSTEWNAFLKSQCSGNADDQIQCDHLTCDFGQTGDYYRRNISGTNYYYSSDANCKNNVSSTTSLTTIKNNQCTGGNPAVLPVDNKCEKITCPLNMSGDYYRGQPPSAGYLYYENFGACRDNIGGVSNQNTVKNKRCTVAINLDQDLTDFALPNGTTIDSPSTAFVIPADYDINALNDGATYTLTIQNPTETTCVPVRSNDISCRNLGGTYLPKIEYDNDGKLKIPTQCCPLQISDIGP